MDVGIRAEEHGDREKVHRLHRQAFGRDEEARLVDALRRSEAFIPELSLVAVRGPEVVGHILFTRILVEAGNAGRSHGALALAPMAVRPSLQKLGIGSALVRRGLEEARRLGHDLVIVVGHPEYYPRFGFVRAEAHDIRPPFPVPGEAFMALELEPGVLDVVQGEVVYPPEFEGASDRDTGAHGSSNERVAARLRVVEEHVRRENEHDLVGIMDTFGDEAQYDDAPWAEQRLGRNAVEQYYRELLAALPDLHIDVRNRFVTEDAVVLEVSIGATHDGPWRGLPATGRPVRFPLCAIYRFGANGKLASETIYYDRAGVLRQLGLYHEPAGGLGRLVTALTHPLTLARAYGRKLVRATSRGGRPRE